MPAAAKIAATHATTDVGQNPPAKRRMAVAPWVVTESGPIPSLKTHDTVAFKAMNPISHKVKTLSQMLRALSVLDKGMAITVATPRPNSNRTDMIAFIILFAEQCY